MRFFGMPEFDELEPGKPEEALDIGSSLNDHHNSAIPPREATAPLQQFSYRIAHNAEHNLENQK